jgi:hypothetical protein
VRLLDECDQILSTGTLDLSRDKEQMKAIRNGEWSLEQINNFFDKQMIYLQDAYNKSTLRYAPAESEIKTLLLECLEMHFGNLSAVVSLEKAAIQNITDAFSSLEKAMRYIK